MSSKLFLATAPGSVFLLGEHAVLHGYPALISAIDHHISVQVKLRNDKQVRIYSGLGHLEVELDVLKIQKPFEFVIASILSFKNKIKSGMDISVESAFSHQLGLGSSAAVTVAAITALRKSLDLPCDLQAIFTQACKVIQTVQGCGSGGDVAASVFGGIVYYQPKVALVERIENDLPLGLFYSGSKMPTPEVIRYVDERFRNNREEQAEIYRQIGECVKAGKQAIEINDLDQLASIFNQQQTLMNKLGVETQALEDLINRLKKYDQIKGIKISGSGLGDCVIVLGDCKFVAEDSAYIPIKVAFENGENSCVK